MTYLTVSLYNSISNNGCVKQQACKIPGNLKVSFSTLGQASTSARQ